MAARISAISNATVACADCVAGFLAQAESAVFSVAYGTHEGLLLLDRTNSLRSFFDRLGHLRTLFDIDRHFTDPDLIDELCTVPGDVQCRLYAPRITRGPTGSTPAAFHAKVYHFEWRNKAASVIGSSNLSVGGLSRNHECSAVIEGLTSDKAFQEIRDVLDGFWNSPATIAVDEYAPFRESYEQAYRDARRRQPRPGVPHESPLLLHDEDLDRLRTAFADTQQPLAMSTLAYICGLMAGGGVAANIRERTVTVALRRGLLNRGRATEGRVFFEGVSKANLLQAECVAADAKRIMSRLKTRLRDMGTGDRAELQQIGDLSYRFIIGFTSKSPLWSKVRAQLRVGMRGTGLYGWPGHLNLGEPPTRRAFLQGYMDLRTRIAATDALPPPTPFMRVAVSIGMHAPRFARRLRELMAAEFACPPENINLLIGTHRGRESIIRLDPRLFPKDFLLSPWQRRVIRDFRSFNESLG